MNIYVATTVMQCIYSLFSLPQVIMLSTIHKDGRMVALKDRMGDDISKPLVVVDYNQGKVGVDVSDQHAAPYAMRRKCVKWYQTLFMHVLDTTLVNAYLISHVLRGRSPGRAGQQLNFRHALFDSLCGFEKQPQPEGVPVVIPQGHYLAPVAKGRRRCKTCSINGVRSTCLLRCIACDVALHPGHCFEEYHR